MVISKKFLYLKQEKQLRKSYIYFSYRCENTLEMYKKNWNGISMLLQKINFVWKTHSSKNKDVLLGEIKKVYL